MRWALAWLLYWTGDLVERWNDNDTRFTERGFDLYQWLMRAADTVQGPSGRGPWSAVARDSDGSLEGRDGNRLDGEAATARAAESGIAQPTSSGETR